MNNLSWFMYLADVLPNLQGLFAIAGGLALFAGILVAVVVSGEGDIEDGLKIIKWAWLPIVLIAVACFIPSTQAMYLIAGSEAGEMVVTSQEGKEILGDIKDVIRTQLNELKKVD